jgi:ABC-type multidrug transport system fused ATPase/permease subunit
VKKYISEIGWRLCLDAFFQLLAGASLAFLPYANKLLVDTFEGRLSWSAFQIIGLYVVSILISVGAGYGSMLIGWSYTMKFDKSLKRDLIKNLFLRSYKMFANRTVPEYVSIQANDLTEFNKDYLAPIVALIVSLSMFLVYGIILFVFVDWRIGLALFVCSVVVVRITSSTSKKLSAAQTDYLNEIGTYTHRITDLLEGKSLVNLRTINNFMSRHDAGLNIATTKRLYYGVLKSKSLAVNGLFTLSINIVGFAFIAYLLLNKYITLGIAVASIGYIESFVSPMQEILYDITTLRSIQKTKEKIFNELDTPIARHSLAINTFNAAIDFNGVEVSVGDFQLRNFTYQFMKQKKYALIGHNGSGKSTLLKLVSRELEQDVGSILIDGYDVAKADCSSVIYCLHQQEHTYAANFNDNISLFGAFDANAYKSALPPDPPQKIDAIDGTANCQTLSGGEKQIANMLRVLNSNCDVLLLDEPFAAMDAAIAEYFEQRLLLLEQKTVITVTHNLNQNLERYDCVLVMENGALVEYGPYAEIINKAAYQRLINNTQLDI